MIPTLLSFSDSVQLKDGKFPEVFWNGNWAPICGHWFWNNNHGATLFCQKLDSSFTSGIVTRREDKPLESDGLRIGECREQDHWLSCSGGGNKLDNPSCGGGCCAGSEASIEIKCQECPEGYESKSGDVEENVQIGSFTDVLTIMDCANHCRDTENCCSFEYSFTEFKCNLNSDCEPNTQEQYKDYYFCSNSDEGMILWVTGISFFKRRNYEVQPCEVLFIE